MRPKFPRWNRMPVSATKHWRIIQRSGIRARFGVVPLATDPPPTSAEAKRQERMAGVWAGSRPTTMAPCEPPLQYVRLPVPVIVFSINGLLRLLGVVGAMFI